MDTIALEGSRRGFYNFIKNWFILKNVRPRLLMGCLNGGFFKMDRLSIWWLDLSWNIWNQSVFLSFLCDLSWNCMLSISSEIIIFFFWDPAMLRTHKWIHDFVNNDQNCLKFVRFFFKASLRGGGIYNLFFIFLMEEHRGFRLNSGWIIRTSKIA